MGETEVERLARLEARVMHLEEAQHVILEKLDKVIPNYIVMVTTNVATALLVMIVTHLLGGK